jgi:hypothetical protein
MKKFAMVAAVALIGLALFAAAPAAAQEDDDIPDGAESTLNETQTAGPVTVDPLVNESGDDERVGFEDSGVDAAGQSAGAEFVVEVDDDGPFYSVSAGDRRGPWLPDGVSGDVLGADFYAGGGAEAEQGCFFTSARTGASAGYSGVPVPGFEEFGEGAGAGEFVTYPDGVSDITCEADDLVPEN